MNFSRLNAMLLVVIESPYRGKDDDEVAANVEYLNRAIMDSLYRGESPFAIHRFWPGLLDDNNRSERALGIKAGLDWYMRADLCAFYVDRGMSEGMKIALERCAHLDLPTEERKLDKSARAKRTNDRRIKRVK